MQIKNQFLSLIEIVLINYFNVKNQEFIRSENYLVSVSFRQSEIFGLEFDGFCY